MHCDNEEGWLGLRVSLFFLSFASFAKNVFQHSVSTSDMSVIHMSALSSVSGSDIVQWMMKNLDIEDQGKSEILKCFVLVYCMCSATMATLMLPF